VTEQFGFRRVSKGEHEPNAECALCHAWLPVAEIFDHLRDAHDVDAEPATWPDGGLVIVDTTLEPADFEDDRP
jgi:hypothetical protein